MVARKQERKTIGKRNRLKAFISYSAADKLIAAEIKNILSRFGIDGFLAHDDIHISEKWKERIVDELKQADIFIPLLSKKFKNSKWAAQEVGIAFIRDVLIIPLSIDKTIPFGFINHLQAKHIAGDNIPLNYLITPVLQEVPEYMITSIIKALETANSFRYAENVMELLVPYFDNLSQKYIDDFVKVCIENRQIWDASKCRGEFLPRFIAINKDKIKTKGFKALSYQIKEGKWYA